jgi:hypothetical protein
MQAGGCTAQNTTSAPDAGQCASKGVSSVGGHGGLGDLQGLAERCYLGIGISIDRLVAIERQKHLYGSGLMLQGRVCLCRRATLPRTC